MVGERFCTLLAFSVFVLANAPGVWAAGANYEIITRDAKDRAVHAWVDLPELLNPDVAETEHFRVVMKKSDAPVRFSELSDEDRLRASNLIYHYTRAREYFIQVQHSEEVLNMEQVVIRLDITNGANTTGHFDNDSLNPKYNSAFSIPPGSGFVPIRKDPNDSNSEIVGRKAVNWGLETFYNPPKSIPTKELLAHLSQDPLDPTIKTARGIVYPTQISVASQNAARFFFTPSYDSSTWIDSLTRQVGTLAVIEASFVVMKQINHALLPKNYYLDAALIPEIIVHEFSHLALSKYLVPTQATPVVEGMADYFAAVIGDSPKLALKIKEYSTGQGKNGSKVKPFDVAYERKEKATSDYVLGLLWGIREVLGAQATDRLVWASRTLLKEKTSDIRTGLLGALINTCKEVCEEPRDDVLKLQLYFADRAKQL